MAVVEKHTLDGASTITLMQLKHHVALVNVIRMDGSRLLEYSASMNSKWIDL